MPRPSIVVLLAAPASVLAACSVHPGSEPTPTVTVTATRTVVVSPAPSPAASPSPAPGPSPAPSSASTGPSQPAPGADDPLAALAPLRETFVLEDAACRGGSGDLDTTWNACDARDHVALAWERTAMAAYERAYRARDEATLLALAGPDGGAQVDHLLTTTADPDEPMSCELVRLSDATEFWECMLWPVEGTAVDLAPGGGWGFLLGGDLQEDWPPEVYVRQGERDLG